MRPKLLVHGSYARCISSPEEVERLLSAGWLLAAPKPKTKAAKTVRLSRERRRAEGWLNLNIWLDAEDLSALRAALFPGETYAGLIMRLIKQQSSSDVYS